MVQIREFNKKEQNRATAEQSADLIKKARKDYDKLVKGMFEFVDAKGGWIEFHERTFKGQNPMTIRLVHGEICELPMGIVKRLNGSKRKIRRFNAEGLTGNVKTPQIYETVSRLKFTPTDVL